jgi:hypothetical protein
MNSLQSHHVHVLLILKGGEEVDDVLVLQVDVEAHLALHLVPVAAACTYVMRACSAHRVASRLSTSCCGRRASRGKRPTCALLIRLEAAAWQRVRFSPPSWSKPFLPVEHAKLSFAVKLKGDLDAALLVRGRIQ